MAARKSTQYKMLQLTTHFQILPSIPPSNHYIHFPLQNPSLLSPLCPHSVLNLKSTQIQFRIPKAKWRMPRVTPRGRVYFSTSWICRGLVTSSDQKDTVVAASALAVQQRCSVTHVWLKPIQASPAGESTGKNDPACSQHQLLEVCMRPLETIQPRWGTSCLQLRDWPPVSPGREPPSWHQPQSLTHRIMIKILKCKKKF